jgi:hypothetical protein
MVLQKEKNIRQLHPTINQQPQLNRPTVPTVPTSKHKSFSASNNKNQSVGACVVGSLLLPSKRNALLAAASNKWSIFRINNVIQTITGRHTTLTSIVVLVRAAVAVAANAAITATVPFERRNQPVYWWIGIINEATTCLL